MKLVSIREIKGRVVLMSGLHIGAGDMDMHIGGIDNPVVKHPHTLEPYIPGSSLKGKVRSLLEMKSGLMGKSNGNPLSLKHLKDLTGSQKDECERILKLFGVSGADLDEGSDLGPTRVSFADCPLDEQWKIQAQQRNWPLTEVKSETSINRIKGTAENPRFPERVPAGAVFTFSVTLKQLDEQEDLLECLLKGLKLLEMDALGGSGSRGYGRIRLEFDDQEIEQAFERIDPLSTEVR